MAINGTMELLNTATVPSGGQAAIEFTNIPQTYKDLVLYVSPRSNASAISSNLFVQFNNDSTGHSDRYMYGDGAGGKGAGTVISNGNRLFIGDTNANSSTTSTFGNHFVYISNYSSSSVKTASIDSVGENNASTAYAEIITGLYTGSAISSIKIMIGDGTVSSFMQHSTAYLYGVARTTVKATGGMITEDSNYIYHTFTASDVFITNKELTADVLVIAGGGGGAYDVGGGGGAGGVLYTSSVSCSSGVSHTITVGGGGAGAGPSNSNLPSSGSNSVFSGTGVTTRTADGGGRAANGSGTSGSYTNASSGGSGGGGTHRYSNGGAGISGQGFAGGNATPSAANGAGGGGGAGGIGGSAPSAASGSVNSGAGGIGTNAYSSWATATRTGHNGYYAGGGGGGVQNATRGDGGLGGGGVGGPNNSAGGNGLTNTGGGGGGAGANSSTGPGGNGGSGIVIIRYAK